MPVLSFHDLHMELDRATRLLKMWNVHHHEVMHCEARNRTVVDGQYGHNGNCPPGEFLLGAPVARGTVAFGAYFMALLDYPPHKAMAEWGRSGIGIHGGGTGLPFPFADRQGWQITHGCWRLQNDDLWRLVRRVQVAHLAGGKVFGTVIDPAVTPAAEEKDDWAPVVNLAPDE
jgi:hypothetical protein